MKRREIINYFTSESFLWNELTILWNDLTIDWHDLTWNDLTMERNDRKSPNNNCLKLMIN